MPSDVSWLLLISLTVLLAVYLFVRYGWTALLAWIGRQEDWYRRVLNQQLLIDIHPRAALGLSGAVVALCALLAYGTAEDWLWGVAGAVGGFFIPNLVVRHLEQKRRQRLERQLVDGITTLASSVRAGLNLVQAMELLVRNSAAPIRQEFAQLLREYQMGLDLNQAMRNAANRIGSSHYRLLFTAIEMHRVRGGDAAESLDRIADSIREIQRLEGRLETLTAQGHTQARLMGAMPVVIIGILYMIDEQGVRAMIAEPSGRIVMLLVAAMILAGFLWIRKIMDIDI